MGEQILAWSRLKLRIYVDLIYVTQCNQRWCKPCYHWWKPLRVCRQSRYLKECSRNGVASTSSSKSIKTEIMIMLASGCVYFLHKKIGLSFLVCHGRGFVTGRRFTRFAHKVWFDIYAKCMLEFLCWWLRTLKEAKHERGNFQQGDRHVLNMHTLDKVEYDDFRCKELSLLGRRQDFTHDRMILRHGFGAVKKVEKIWLWVYTIDNVLSPNRKTHQGGDC